MSALALEIHTLGELIESATPGDPDPVIGRYRKRKDPDRHSASLRNSGNLQTDRQLYIHARDTDPRYRTRTRGLESLCARVESGPRRR